MTTMRIAATLLALSVAAVAAAPQPALAQAEPAPATQPNEVITRGKVDAVTVYRGQALVSRSITLPAGTGLSQIVVSELPDRLVPSSLFAEGADGIEIRSVRYRERPVAQDVREEVRKLDDQIRAANDKLAALAKQLQVLGEQRAYLDKLEGFTAPTASTEMTRGVLNADQLKNLTTFQFETRKAIADQELKFQQDQRTIQEQVQLLDRQKGDITGRSSRTLREAVIFINRERPAAPAAGSAIRIRYLVDGATWSPSYNVRANAEKTAATLEYQAAIEQLSGEDWNDVAMTLSTATPSLVAAAPSLIPLQIALAAGGGGAGGRGGGMGGGGGGSSTLAYESVEKGIITLRNNAEQARNQNGGNGIFDMHQDTVRQQFIDNDKALNRVADQLQVLELVTRDGRKEDGTRRQADEAIVVTYQLRARTSLPSRSDRQLIQIDQLALKSQFYKVAVPVLTSYVYDEADLTNTSPIVLLGGPIASYVGGQFVGGGTIDTVAVGQPFTVGFGIDSSLRATREREDKTEQISGGNRIVNFTYRLAIENFGSKPADVRLMDRLPVGKETEVRVNFEDAADIHVSTDKEYAAQRKNGILRWDVHVPAQKNGSEAFAFNYKLHLEHDRNLAISTAGLLGPELNELLNK